MKKYDIDFYVFKNIVNNWQEGFVISRDIKTIKMDDDSVSLNAKIGNIRIIPNNFLFLFSYFKYLVI